MTSKKMSKAKDVIEIDETKHNVWFISDLLKRMTESEWVKEYLEFELIREIRKCKYYEWDNDACEEYCTKLKDANFDSKKACPICKYYSPKESDKRTYEQGKKESLEEIEAEIDMLEAQEADDRIIISDLRALIKDRKLKEVDVK